MPSTTRGYPYPLNSDRVDVPGHMEAALEAVDSDVGGHVGDSTIHHTLGTGATNAAAGNHTHAWSSITGGPSYIAAHGQVTVTILDGDTEAYADFNAGMVQTGGHIFVQALGGADRFAIVDQTQPGPTDQFRVTVWSTAAVTGDEVRYVNWILVI